MARKLSTSELEILAAKAKDWALTNGLTMRSVENKKQSDLGQIAPLTLFPTPFPRKSFEEALRVQKDMNLLYLRVSLDRNLIESSLASVIKTDNFNKNLMDIYKNVMDEGLSQPAMLQIQRCDYMCSIDQNQQTSLKQVEVNNIASSFGGLSSKVTSLHRYILRENGQPAGLINNNAVDTVAMGLVQAWIHYSNQNAVVLFLVDEVEQNITDQRSLEYKTHELSDQKCRTIRMTFDESIELLTLNQKKLINKADKFAKIFVYDTHSFYFELCSSEIAVVYFRTGYVPTQYNSEDHWKTRLLIERSLAIKCPFIGLHLAGTKKIQQILAAPGMVEKYMRDDSAAVDRIRKTFTGMWGLEKDQPSTKAILQQIANNADNFVLKPQLEGGGNNVYGKDIPKFINSLSPNDLEAFIVMEMIRPPINKVQFIRVNESLTEAESISELGTYGYLLGDAKTKEVLFNVQGGHLLRTKAVNVDEGGIMAGASAIDSPLILD